MNNIFKRIVEFFKNDRSDPVRHCATYKKFKCSHVDGVFCERHECEGFKKASSNVDLRVLLRTANKVAKQEIKE